MHNCMGSTHPVIRAQTRRLWPGRTGGRGNLNLPELSFLKTLSKARSGTGVVSSLPLPVGCGLGSMDIQGPQESGSGLLHRLVPVPTPTRLLHLCQASLLIFHHPWLIAGFMPLLSWPWQLWKPFLLPPPYWPQHKQLSWHMKHKCILVNSLVF